MEEGHIFFSGVTTYRKRSHLIVGLVLAAFCVPAFVRTISWIPDLLKSFTLGGLLALAFVMLVTGVMGYVGCSLVYMFVTKRAFKMKITTEGISLNGKLFPWSDVRAIGTEGFVNGRCQLVFHRMGRMPVDRHIDTDEGLSEEEFRHLMAELKAKVGPLHPNVTFVGGR
jgi:hypothetical protein